MAFGVSWISESIGASSVIATVIAGLMINYRMHKFGGLGRESIDMLEALWEFLGFTVSSIALIFVGMNINIPVLLENYYLIICIFVFIIGTRFLIVYGLAEIIERSGGEKLPYNWRFCLSWSGLRGAISAVLALGVSSLVAINSDVIIVITFGLVLFSNVVQGLSISGIVRRFAIIDSKGTSDEIEKGSSVWMRDRYISLGFKKESSRAEKLLFALPEYFVFETRFGSWIAFKLEGVHSYINGYLNNTIPKTSGGALRRTLLFTASLSSMLSKRIYQAKKNYYINGGLAGEKYRAYDREVKHQFSRSDVIKSARSSATKD
jgi:NhaP-type Na+/H+ or K+/H+ antiporter